MLDGIYAITFRGAADWGMGLLVLYKGTITGADVGGALYDGKYIDQGDTIQVDMVMKVPPGVTLVQGTAPRSTAYEVPFNVVIDKKAFENNQPVLVNLPPGPVNVIFKRLRTI